MSNNYVQKATGASPTGLTDSLVYDDGTYVGIGTTSPQNKLQVNGVISAAGNSDLPSGTTTYLMLAGDFGSPVTGRIFVGDGSGWKMHFSKRSSGTTTDLVTFQDNGKAIFGSDVTVAGKLGAGTTSPGSTLDVNGVLSISGNSDLPSTTGSILRWAGGFSSPVAGRLFWGDGTGWKMYFSKRISGTTTDLVAFQDNGNVGIGGTSPGTLLDVGTSADSILTGGVDVASVGRLATRYASSASSGSLVGTESYVDQTAATSGSLQGLVGFAHSSHSSGTVSLLIGVAGNAESTGSSTTTTIRGLQGGASIRSSGGGTDAACVYANPSGRVGSGSGTFTNGYGLLVGTFGSGFTNKYGVYAGDLAASNYLAGNVSVGVDGYGAPTFVQSDVPTGGFVKIGQGWLGINTDYWMRNGGAGTAGHDEPDGIRALSPLSVNSGDYLVLSQFWNEYVVDDSSKTTISVKAVNSDGGSHSNVRCGVWSHVANSSSKNWCFYGEGESGGRAFRVNNDGSATFGTTSLTIAQGGTVNVENGYYSANVFVAKSATHPTIGGVQYGDTVELGGGYAGSVGTVIVGASSSGLPPTTGAYYNGLIVLDTTNNRLCFYVGGNRYYIAGTSF